MWVGLGNVSGLHPQEQKQRFPREEEILPHDDSSCLNFPLAGLPLKVQTCQSP